MPLSERAYLNHLRSACLEIARDLAQAAPEEFDQGGALRNSILYSLIVIGEAVNQLPLDLLARYPEIPWRSIVDLRKVLTHRYFAIDPLLVRQTADVHVPRLLSQVEIMLAEGSGMD